jgi:aspartate/methionine/tyrosine aminotransferase
MTAEHAPLDESATLTDWEWLGLHSSFNLADGHAHYPMPEGLEAILATMPGLLERIEERTQQEYEAETARRFFEVAGQQYIDRPPLMFHYSSSVSIEMAAKALVETGRKKALLLSPTFDNIPLLLRRAGMNLRPLREDDIDDTAGDLTASSLDSGDVVFLVLPNNPTGWIPTQSTVERLVRRIADVGATLVIDFSFRFYSRLHLWDQYELVRSVPGLDWILLEDTGKTWSLAEMKVGMCSCSSSLRPVLESVTSELLLNVSPFTLSLLSRMMAFDLGQSGQTPDRRLHAAGIVDINRQALRSVLADSAWAIASPASEISVEWIRLPSRRAVGLCNRLSRAGVTVLPGGPFFWDRKKAGNGYVRVALAREPRYFSAAVAFLKSRLLVEGII